MAFFFSRFFAYYICYNAYLIHSRDFLNDGYPIYLAIDKSKKKVSKKKVIFGDSVGMQLYPNHKDKNKDIYSLTTTGPSSLVGVYVMLVNFIKINDPEGVVFYYVINPGSLDRYLKDEASYNHFVKPFYTLKNFQYFSSSVHDAIRGFPYWYAAQIPFIKISDWQPEVKFNMNYGVTISPIYIEYFKKIQELAKKNHFQFYALMPILREDYRMIDYSEIKKVIGENALDEIFSCYFSDIKYIPNDQFHENSNHYLNPSRLGDNPLGI